MEYYPEVVQAVPGKDYTIYVYFSNGQIRHFDMNPLIEKGGVFARLRDTQFFRDRLTVMNATAAWDITGDHDPTRCIDIDPETLYAAEAVTDPLQSVG